MTPAQKQQFEDEGYFILENFLTDAEVDEAVAELDRFVEETNNSLGEGGRHGINRRDEIVFTAFLAEKSVSLRRLVKNDKFVALTTALIGPDVRLYWNQAVYKFPETEKEFPWHQDNGYTPVDPEQYYTCWIALTDVTLENGCVWLLPGTHKLGTQPHKDSELGRVGYFGDDKGVPVELKKGSMAVFSSLTFHRSGSNLTNGIRKAYIVQYIPSHTVNARTGEGFADRLWIAKNGLRVDGDG